MNTFPSIPVTNQHVRTIAEFLTGASQRILKACVLLARYRGFPENETTSLYQKISVPLYDHLQKDFQQNECELILDSLRCLTESSASSSILLSMCYTVEPPKSIVSEIKEESFTKEFSVTQAHRRHPTINWDAIFKFSPSTPQRLSPYLPYNQALHSRLSTVFGNLRTRYVNAVLIPFASKKGVSEVTQEEVRFLSGDVASPSKPPRHISARDLLSYGLRNGEAVGGPSEMKQKWYPVGLKPRTYYAQGGDCFWASTYLRMFFNEMADNLPYTNRFGRVDASRIFLFDRTDSSHFFVYDYENFTSNFSEQYHFLSALSEFFWGTPVQLLTSDFQTISVSLGALIERYRDVCNDNPMYYLSEGVFSLSGFMTNSFDHVQAGFLGVYGNLMTCTVPHGIVARSLASTDSSVGVAGDDGALDRRFDNRTTDNVLLSLGSYATDKSMDQEMVYLKQRLELVDGRFHQEYRPTFPLWTFANLINHGKTGSTRFPHLASMTAAEASHSCYVTLKKFVRDCCRSPIFSPQNEAIIIESVNDTIDHFQLGFHHSSGNTLKLKRSNKSSCYVPAMYHLETGFQRSSSRFPMISNTSLVRRRCRSYQPLSIDMDLTEGITFEVNQSRVLDYLECSGYVQKVESEFEDETMFEFVRVCDLPEYIQQGPELYTYTVLRDIPIDGLFNVFRMKSETLHKRQMSVAQFEDFASDRKAVHRFISNTEYVDLDMPMDTGFVDTLDYFSDEVEGVLPEDDVLDVGVSDRYNRVV